MRRIHTTYDLLEAHIITEMLRANGIDAWLFDADFVRQDWFKSIAYGGYRILVPDDLTSDALVFIAKYRNGELALDDDEGPLACPNCGKECGIDDPRPRRVFFIAWFVSSVAMAFAMFSQPVFYATATLLLAGTLVVSFMGSFLFKWRYVCFECRHHWREPPQLNYFEMQSKVAPEEVAGQS